MSSIPFRVTHRRTSTSGRVPALNTLLTGEIYLQLADELVYFKNAADTRLVTLITDASGNGLEKIKFSGASNLDIPYWSGSRFYATGISNFVQKGQTGNFVITSQISNFVSKSETGIFITTSQTGSFGGGGNIDLSSYVLKSQTGNFITSSQTGAFGGTNIDLSSYVTTGQTGAFALASNTGNFVTNAQTGVFALAANTGNFVTTAQTGVFALSANTGSFVTTAQTGVFALSADTGSFVTTAQTGVFALSANTGSFVTTAQTGVFALSANTGSFVTTSQTGVYASLDGSNYLKQSQIPNITGDICINAGSNVSTVYKIQGYPVANTQPVNGQTLQFNGSSWVPGDIAAGGNGGGGLVYYFNDPITADLPTGNLPTSLSGTFELGRTGTLSQYTVTATNLSEVSYDPIVGFVSDVLDPNTTAIPAGLFDFNIWASSNSATQTILQLKVYKYDGATTTATLLATSDDVYTYDGAVTSQYIMSIVLPQTSLSSTDRLFILISAKALANNKDITLYFGGNTPSHVHTTIPSVGGSGLVKVINGIMQNSASQLVDADVSSSAAIAGSKIQAGYFALASETGVFALSANTGNFVTTSQTGVFALSANTGNFVTSGQTGNFVSNLITGNQNIVLRSLNSNISGVSNSVVIGGSGNCISGSGSNSIILAGTGIVANSGNTAYANNFCAVGGRFFGDGCGLTLRREVVINAGDSVSQYSLAIGGINNTIGGSAIYSIVIGGNANSVSPSWGTVVGGSNNRQTAGTYGGIFAGGSNCLASNASVILGGGSNCICNASHCSAILGGEFNLLGNVGGSAPSSMILGGCANSIIVGCYSAIIAGRANSIVNGLTGVVVLGGCLINANSSNTVYAVNYCATGGKFFGDGSALTGLATGNFITTSQTGAFGGANVDLSNYITTGQTGNFVSVANTGNFVTTAQTGVFALAANTGSFVTTAQTGVFALAANTGSFVTTAQTGNFITSGQTGIFALSANTGSFVTSAQTGVFITTGMTGAFNTQNFDLNDYVTTGSTGNFVTKNETGQLGNLIVSTLNLNLNQSCFSKANDSYACVIGARKITSNANLTYLEYNNSTSLVNLDPGDHLTFTATINAIGCNVGSYAYFKIEGSARRYVYPSGNLTATCSLLNGETSNQLYSTSYSGYDAIAEIDNSSNSLKIKVIGDNSHQQQWFAKIDFVKNNYIIDSQIILPQTLYFSGNSSDYNWFNCNNWYTNAQLTNRSLSFAQTGSTVIVCGNKGPLIDLTCNLWNTPTLINALSLTDASGVCFYSPLNQPTGFSGIVSGVASFFGGAYLI